MELKGSYASQAEAIAAANKLKGHEAIKKEADGQYSIHSLSAEEKKAVDQRDFSQFTEDIVSFSLDQPKGADKVLDRFSGHQYKNLDAAKQAASAHEGHEAFIRNSNGTISLFPFVEDDKLQGAEAGNFSKFSKDIIAVSLDRGASEEFKEAVDARSKTLVSNAETLMDKIHANQQALAQQGKKGKLKEKPNQYVLGGEKVDIDKGKVAADCSGFIKAMYEKIGVEFGPRTADAIGDLVRSNKGPFRQIRSGSDIRPGDILSFELPERTEISGHIMMAVGEPEAIVKNGKTIGYNIRIIDSTSKEHTDDTDHGKGKSGAGLGTITVGVDAQDKVNSLSWKADFGGYTYRHGITVGRLK